MEKLLILLSMGQGDLSNVPQLHDLFAGGCDPWDVCLKGGQDTK